MKKIKLSAAALLLVAPLAFATTYYIPIPGSIQGGYDSDKDSNWDNARQAFDAYQTAHMTSKVAPGDTVYMQYQDGSVIQITLGNQLVTCDGNKHCQWVDPINGSSVMPAKKQVKIPPGKEPTVVGLSPGSYMPIFQGTVVFWKLQPSVTITQQDLAISVLDLNTGGGGGGGSGGGGGGGGGWNDCGADCPPVMEE